MESNDDLARDLAAAWARRRPEARDVRVESLARIFGGASRETWRFTLRARDARRGASTSAG